MALYSLTVATNNIVPQLVHEELSWRIPSCSYFFIFMRFSGKKLTKIIVWCPHLWVGGPYLRNPGSATAPNQPNLADCRQTLALRSPPRFVWANIDVLYPCRLSDQSFKKNWLNCSTSSNDPNKQTNRQTDRQTNRQTGRQTHKQTNRQTNRQADKQTNKQTNRQTDIQTNKCHPDILAMCQKLSCRGTLDLVSNR